MASKNVEAAFAALRAEGFMIDAQECPVLSIDAWNSPDGWTWNQWWKIDTVPVYICDLKPRALLAYLRERGILGAQSGSGDIRVEFMEHEPKRETTRDGERFLGATCIWSGVSYYYKREER